MLRYLPLIFVLILISTPTLFAAETRGLAIIAKDPATGQPTGEVKLYNKAWAVFIGIDHYQEAAIPRLKNAVNDALGVKQVLEQRFKFDDYRELYDDKATQKSILELFQDELADKVAEDDAVFVFWAGHGTQQDNNRFGEIGELIPYDGSLKKHSRNISMETLKTNISKSLKARHVFYVMDACYGGLMADKRAVNQDTQRTLKALQQIAKDDVRQVLTAGSKGEQVLDGANGHSVFTYRLIEALEAAGDFITANEIQAIITRNVASDALKYDHKQTPQYGKLYGQGDFVFVPSKEYQLAEKQAEIDNIRKQSDQTRQDNERIKKQMADDEALIAEAVKAGDDSKRQTAELELKRKQGLLKLEEAKQQESERQLHRAEQEAAELKQRDIERVRIQEEARRQQLKLQEAESHRATELAKLEKEQQLQKAEEERQNAELRRQGEAKRKKALEAASTALSIEAAVEQIRKTDEQISGINNDFDAELARQKAAADRRLAEKKARLSTEYDKRMLELKSQPSVAVIKPLIPSRDEEFETKAEYQAKVKKIEDDYNKRLAEAQSVGSSALRAENEMYEKGLKLAEAKYYIEVTAIDHKITVTREEAISPFRDRIATIAAKEYPVPPQVLKLTIGMYNPEDGKFPVSIGSTSPSVKLSVEGTLSIPRDKAKQFKQQYQNGLLRVEAYMKTGNSVPVRVAMLNDGVQIDADNSPMEYADGEFLNVAERKRRNEAAAAAVAAERDRLVYTDPQTSLMWLRNGNIAGKEMRFSDAMSWVNSCNYGGYSDWRLPTQYELESIAKRGGDRPSKWLNSNGFNNVQAYAYWSSSDYKSDISYIVNMSDGKMGTSFKIYGNYVLAVRSTN